MSREKLSKEEFEEKAESLQYRENPPLEGEVIYVEKTRPEHIQEDMEQRCVVELKGKKFVTKW